METEQHTPGTATTSPATGTQRSRFAPWRRGAEEEKGQAIVEFAIVSVAFFMIVFGTVDFGRAIYMYSQLHSAVQEGARLGKSDPCDKGAVRDMVIADASSFNLETSDVSVDWQGKDGGKLNDCRQCAKLEVQADAEFSAITQDFLGIKPIHLQAVSIVSTE